MARAELEARRPEPEVDRLWAGVNERGTRRRARRRMLSRGLPLAVLGALLVVFFVALRRPSAPSAGPLALSSGPLPTQLVGDPSTERDVRFLDGSDVVMEPGALVEILENTGDRFVAALRSGGCTFDVHPGGPRRWVIESGHVRVEVIGTKFVVERRPGVVHVAVDHGVVVVRGDHVPDGVQRLVAGTTLDVVDDAVSSTTSGSAATTAVQPAPSTLASVAPPPLPTTSAAATTQAPASSGSSAATGAASAADALGELLHEAETAEKNGQIDVAIARLRAVVAAGGGDARTAVASFGLARLLLAARPAEAATVLENALARGMPKALEEHARARLVEAYAKSGQGAAASASAADYLARYPSGAHRDEVERWSSPK